MTWHCLAHIRPLDSGTETRVDVRVCSAQLRSISGLGGEVWQPAMVEAPKLKISLFNGDFQAAVLPGEASLPIALGVLKEGMSGVDALLWAGAEVTIYAGKVTDAWPWQEVFTGAVRLFDRKTEKLTLNCAVDTETFDADVLPDTYSGTGGVEGPADLKGQVKPLAIGRARNVEPVAINLIDNVYQFSAYGPIEAVTALYERGSDFGAPVADYADYTALVAATVEKGTWATCLAEGLIRLGAPAYGLITADILGHEVGGSTPRLTGAVIKALASIAGISSGDLETASLDALDVAVPYNINLFLREKRSFLDVSRELALACNYQAGVSLLGKFFVAGVDIGAGSSITIEAKGRREPQVKESDEEFVSPPYHKTIMGADRSWRVQTYDEIAYYAPLIDRGLWSATETYREGNIVVDADGNQWLYTNPVATSGNVPEDGSAFWSSLSGEPGIITERYPTPAPDGVKEGSLYFDEDNHPYRYEGAQLDFEGDLLDFEGDPLEGPGWVSVRDKGIDGTIELLQSLDDDGVLTKSEKTRIAIPEDDRLEKEYQGILAQATAVGISVADLTTARAAWIALRDGLTPAWNDTSQDTVINRDDWDAVLSVYREAIAAAKTAVAAPAAVSVVPPPAQLILRDETQTVKSGELPRTLSPVVKRGTLDIKTNDDTSYSITTTNCTATVDDTNGSGTKGDITLTAISDDAGSIELTVTVGGVAFGPYEIAFTTRDETTAVFSANKVTAEIPLPDGKILLIQGDTDTVPGNTKQTYDFDEEYEVAPVVNVSGNPDNTAKEGNAGLVGNPTVTGFEANNTTDVTVTMNWMAIGQKKVTP